METSLSQQLESLRGQHSSSLENTRLLAMSLDMPHRIRLATLLRDHEYTLVDRATQAFCDATPEFEAPPGSLRRKKGHQNGRLFLRYIGQCVREGSMAPLQEGVLSWLVGHLDEANVTGKHIEVFMHYLCLAVYQELPSWSHRPLQTVFEEAIQATRLASYSGVIHRGHRRIAQFVIDRMSVIFRDRTELTVAIGSPKCKRDLEILVKEFAKLMHGPNHDAIVLGVTRWLCERLLSEVDYPAEVWYWTLQCLQEGITQCCGTDASFQAGDILEAVSDRIEPILSSTQLLNQAGPLADLAATALMNEGVELGLYRTDELREQLVKGYRRLWEELAVLSAAGLLKRRSEWVSELWAEVAHTAFPTTDVEFQPRFLKQLLLAGDNVLSESQREWIRTSMKHLAEVARRQDQVQRLAEQTDSWLKQSLQPGLWPRFGSPWSELEQVQHLQLLVAQITLSVQASPTASQTGNFRKWLVDHWVSRPNFDATAFQNRLQNLEQQLNVLEADLQEAVKPWLTEAQEVIARVQQANRSSSVTLAHVRQAVDQAFDTIPNHADSSKSRKRGYRDGLILMRRLEDFALIGGPFGEQLALDYFQFEIVAHSHLRGALILQYLEGLKSATVQNNLVRHILDSLIEAVPRLAAAYRLYDQSQELASQISNRTLSQMPEYSDAIGAEGRAACDRDNGIMLRGLCRFLLAESLDRQGFQQWWQERIGKFLATFPKHAESAELCSSFNLNNTYQILEEALDRTEFSALSNLRQDRLATHFGELTPSATSVSQDTSDSNRRSEAFEFAFSDSRS